MNFYKRFVADIQAKTRHLTPAEFGIYDRLLDHYYSTEQPLPGDLMRCYSIAGCQTKADRTALSAVLVEFFVEGDDGMYRQRRAEKMIAEAQPKIEAARTNGKHGGRPRKNPTGTQLVPEKNPVGFKTETQTLENEKASQSLDRERERETPPPPCRGEAVGFAEFWRTWPAHFRKVAREQCERKWRAKGCEAFADRVIAALEVAKKSTDWTKDSGDFTPSPLVWLNQARWEAEAGRVANAEPWANAI